MLRRRESVVEKVPARSWREWVRENGAVLVDVREPHEWRAGTLPGARLMAMSSFDPGALDPETPVLLVCRSGNRSLAVGQALAGAGFRRVGNLEGGMIAVGRS